MINMKKGLDYKDAGVDIDEGERLIKLIRPLAASTRRSGVLGSIGGFGALFSASFKAIDDPVLVSSTDGVGTKLEVAFMANRHTTVGKDLVAMCVNDVLACGAEPLFFLDYMAFGKLDRRRAASVVKGIAGGCRDAGCALVGGETAEMPGIYAPGVYDLAGFAVGVVERSRIIDGSGIRAGDRLIGLASSGLHSNGYSLARKVLFDRCGLGLKDKPRGLSRTLGAELLTPTRIYVRPVLKVLKRFTVRAIAHITGGGLPGNIARVLPSGLGALVYRSSWPVPPIFKLIQDGGGVDPQQMLRTFNCGIGMVLVVAAAAERAVKRALKASGERVFSIGEIVKKRGNGVEFVD